MNKLFFLMTILALAIGTMYVVGCGDDDDDNDTDDDTATDDTGDDDDASDCETGLSAVYDDCGLALSDVDGNQLTYEEAVAYCEDGDEVATCAAGCGLTAADCDELSACFADSCG